MSIATKFWNWVFPKNTEPFEIIETEIPYHIKETAKLYPILHTVSCNRALGEVKKFKFLEHENTLRVGQAIIINDKKKKFTSTWIHVGNDYFKLVMKA